MYLYSVNPDKYGGKRGGIKLNATDRHKLKLKKPLN